MIVLDDISASVDQVNQWLSGREPELAMVLGSGLTAVLDLLADPIQLAYDQLASFPATAVTGHAGCLHSGFLDGRSVLIFQGRFHCYEGYSAWQVTAPVRLAAALGCAKLLLTNAAGGIDEAMSPGDFMLVTDHLNFACDNPLRGRPEAKFLDLGQLYCHQFYPSLEQELAQQGIALHSGTLAWMLGPCYETPAEIRFLASAGASAVSMSTIPEAIVARRYALDVSAVSYISNLAAGKSAGSLDHQDVLASGARAATSLRCLVSLLVNHWLG